jgi:hypothetical protein
MAFDQVSLFLFPPRWRRHSVADSQMRQFSGQPVWIVSAVRAEESKGSAVGFDALCRWFEAKGFEVVARSEKYANFHSAAIESALGRRPEIDVSASAEGSEVTSLYCRFLLNREAPLHLERWEAFIQEVCAAFTMRICVTDAKSMGPEEFVSVIRQSDAWHCFAEQFGWSKPSEGRKRDAAD